MYQCAPGTPAVSPGWSVYGYNTDASTVLSNSCSSAGAIGDYVFSNGQAGAVTENGSSGSQVGLALSVPGSAPDVTIAAVSTEVLASPVTGDDAFVGFSSDGQSLPGAVELADGGSGYDTSDSWTLPQGARDFEAYVNCSTDHSSTTCYFADPTNVPALTDITLTLQDNTPPDISGVSGGVAAAAASGATLSGSQTLSFTATDAGSGVRSATVTLIPQTGEEPVTHTFDFASECTYDSWNVCPLTQSVSGYTLNTATLADDTYAVELSVTDAAGNETSEQLGAFTSDNAPTDTTPPSIAAAENVTVGSSLTAEPGSWSAASEAGPVSYGYQWETCGTQGEHCQAITGADTATYTPIDADVGHTLRALVTAADYDGEASASSPQTPTIGSPAGPVQTLPGPGSPTPTIAGIPPSPNLDTSSPVAQVSLNGPVRIARTYMASALTVTGRLRSTAGTPVVGASLDILETPGEEGPPRLIGHATTASDGTFTVRVAEGSSRTLTVAYPGTHDPGGYAAQASVTETVDSGVQLRITPVRTSATGSITITGSVGGPIPHDGVLVELLVHYRGQWVPFRAPRTNAAGRFRSVYQFQGGSGRFPFRAEIPAGQADFPYASGYSNIVRVST